MSAVAVWPCAVAVTFLSLAIWPSTALLLYRHAGQELQDGHVTHTSEHVTPCECRTQCMASPQCGGYSLAPHGGKQAFVCSFAAGNLTKDNLTATARPGVATHLKGPACMPPFEAVPNAGCFFLSPSNATRALALQSCPQGSELFTPRRPAVYWTLADYLLKKTSPVRKYWTSLQRQGEYFVSPRGWRVPALVGTGFWGSNDPNGGSADCATMIKNTEGYFYHLADDACTQEWPYICHKI